MLNERNEINALLEGKRLDKKHTYRSCYLLAKHFKEFGLDMLDTRKAIFDWAKQFGVYISDDLNGIIQRAFNDKHIIVTNVAIKISKRDLQNITSKFDKYNTRLVAFALLCFAKQHADNDGNFYISLVGLSNWIGIVQRRVYDYLKELEDFKFIEKISNNGLIKFKYKKEKINKMNFYKIVEPFDVDGEFMFSDNDIDKEFKSILSYL